MLHMLHSALLCVIKLSMQRRRIAPDNTNNEVRKMERYKEHENYIRALAKGNINKKTKPYLFNNGCELES